MTERAKPRPIVPIEVLKELRRSVQDRSHYVLGTVFLQWFCNKDINFFGLNVGSVGNLVVDTMSYRRTKICLMLSWDVLVGMLPMRQGRSGSLWKLQSMACCSCGDCTPINRNQFYGRRWAIVFLGYSND